ncbi:MAG: D-aminopeptidase [Saprospiraceae bacterium]|nr:D-aminopeptidase [Saprospiraceae bacterium]
MRHTAMLIRSALPVIGPLLALTATHAATAQADTTLTARMDAVLAEHFTPDAPGGVVLVAKGDRILYERALGMADVAANKPLTTASQFRIGSITKQFTAVAILQLADQGKLKLTDEIQRYVDFPKKEHPITIEHLLTHTSGIPNFTDLPAYNPEAFAVPVSLEAEIKMFKDLPLEFKPGTKWNYSNSGYILLTAIIEKVAGRSWSDHVAEHLLRPVGMTSSSASLDDHYLPREPGLGYQPEGEGWVPALPVSLTWPRGAGSIRSTVEDLWKWNTAVKKGNMVPAQFRERAFTSFVLANDTACGYGYGWMFQNVQGSPTREHSGGINGATSNMIYLPKEDVFVVVLVNRESADAHSLAPELAAIALGKPYGGPEVPLTPEQARAYAGVYRSEQGVTRYVTSDSDGLHAQREGGKRFRLQYLGNDRFRYVGDVINLTFQRTHGKVTDALLQTRQGDDPMTLTDEPLPTRTAIALHNADLLPYVGEYELAPGFTLTFRAEGDRFFLRPTGQQELEVFGSAPNEFFLTVVDATITFHPEADGSVQRLTFRQGKEMEGKRVN